MASQLKGEDTPHPDRLLLRLFQTLKELLNVLSGRQNKLEEALLFSGQFTDALQALIDWLYKVEPQLAEDQPVHGDIDLVLHLIDNHKVGRLTEPKFPQPSSFF